MGIGEDGKKSVAENTKPQGQWFTGRNLRDVAIIAAIAVVTWKVAKSPLNISIDKFSYTDLLALILALFSIWLSAMFYFKADEASGRFYDNSYRFTKDMDVMLHRIEASFGEKLKSLDEGQTRMNDTLGERMATVKVAVQEKTETVLAAAASLTSEEAGATPVSDEERRELLNKLKVATDELDALKQQLGTLQRLSDTEQSKPPNSFVKLKASTVMFNLAKKIGHAGGVTDVESYPIPALVDLLRENLKLLSTGERAALRAADFIHGDSERPTLNGVEAFYRALVGASAKDVAGAR